MHIVWDWNGTLFDDRDAILDATNEVFRSYGLPPMELDHYRSVYSRPIWASYERILGRALEEGEWERLDAADVVMVGDSVDDAIAARHVGARAILYTGGLQTRADLDRLGVPVIDRLSDVTVHI
jgi:phosphoglycolate phosphatase-like HAD superfamily hydrolase